MYRDDIEAGNIDTAPTLVIMGVSGAGKSTVAQRLADRLGWDMQEGDDLHPQANVSKMADGIPLTDDDRWPWLAKVGDWINRHRETHRPGIVTCSALKRKYRSVLAMPNVIFVHLDGDLETLTNRMKARKGHYMPVSLLPSQLEALEQLGRDEPGIVVSLKGSPDQEVNEIINRLGLMRWARAS